MSCRCSGTFLHGRSPANCLGWSASPGCFKCLGERGMKILRKRKTCQTELEPTRSSNVSRLVFHVPSHRRSRPAPLHMWLLQEVNFCEMHMKWAAALSSKSAGASQIWKKPRPMFRRSPGRHLQGDAPMANSLSGRKCAQTRNSTKTSAHLKSQINSCSSSWQKLWQNAC